MNQLNQKIMVQAIEADEHNIRYSRGRSKEINFHESPIEVVAESLEQKSRRQIIPLPRWAL